MTKTYYTSRKHWIFCTNCGGYGITNGEKCHDCTNGVVEVKEMTPIEKLPNTDEILKKEKDEV